MALREGLTRCAAGAAHRRPTLTVILTLPSRLRPPRPQPHPRPHRPMARAVGPRLTRCPTLALAPGGQWPRGRGRSTRRVLPRVVAARPHAGSALRRVTPATGRLRGPRAGTEWESVLRVRGQRGAQESSTRRRTRAAAYPPDTHPPLWAMPTMRRAVLCGRCAPPGAVAGGLGAQPRARPGHRPSCCSAPPIASESCLRGSLARWRALWSGPTVEVLWREFAETAAHSLGVPPAA